MTQFKKQFSEMGLPNKDYIIMVWYAPECYAKFIFCYNSISGGYMGLQVDSFIEDIRGLLKVVPDFFEQIDQDYPRRLKEMGFEEVDMPKKYKEHYEMIYRV